MFLLFMERILKNKLYMITLAADLISNFGDTLYYLALMNYVVQLPDSKFAVSLITISEVLPVLGTFILGYYADRAENRLKKIIWTLIFRIFLYTCVAIIMGFQPALWIVLAACLANALSDTAGQYENSLFYPVSNRIVAKEDREKTMAFRQSVTTGLSVAFQASGAILIGIMSYTQLALVNALTFAVSMGIMIGIRQQLQEKLDTVSTHTDADTHKISSIHDTDEHSALDSDKDQDSAKTSVPTKLRKPLVSELKYSVRALTGIRGIRQTLLIVPVLNAGLSVVAPLVLLILVNDPHIMIRDSSITIALIGIATTLGSIAGGLLTIAVLKTVTVMTVLRIEVVTLAVLFISVYFHNIYLILPAIFLSSLWVGCLNPKMGALIFNNTEEKRLATVFGGMATYFQLGDIVSKIFFSGIILFLRVQAVVAVFIVISCGLCCYVFFPIILKKLAPK